MSGSLSKYAFTLAEVLITLGVIGVVAALTMPSVLNNVQKYVINKQFKKSYSTLFQGLRQVEADLGYKPECYGWDKSPYAGQNLVYCIRYNADGNCTAWGNNEGKPVPSDYNGRFGECDTFWKQFEKSVKVVKICENKAYPDCIPEYGGIDTVRKAENESMSDVDINQATSGASWWRKNEILNNRKAYVLADGSIMLFKGSWPGNIGFAIDVNGKKGPNKWGYDIFEFVVYSTDLEPLMLRGGALIVEKGGMSSLQMIKNIGE